ncbi:MAG: TrpB-like pyridoxal-phosphate dependent enzyme, partial [Nitrososphaerota archaeon]
HGDAPTLCLLLEEGFIEPKAYDQISVFEAATLFARTEGIIPAPEPSHTIKFVIEEALRAKEENEEKVILFNLCGHGYFDLKAYQEYFEGNLKPYYYPEEKIRESIERIFKEYPWISNLPYLKI